MNAAAIQTDEDFPQRRSIVLLGGDVSAGGGANRVVRDLSTIFSERLGLATTVISLTDRNPTYPFSPAVQVENHPEAVSRRGYWRLMRELSRRKPDYLIGFWHWDNIRIALNARLVGQRAIVTEHTSWHHPPLKTRFARALTYRFATAVCVLNPVELGHYRRFLENVVLLPNPVPPFPSPHDMSKEKLILAVGHLIERKNFRDAVLAMATSGLAGEGWRLAIIGAGPEREALEHAIRDTGLSHAVDIVPPTGEIAGWYARAAVILITSKIEVFSLVLAEAMSMAVVPLAYAVDGPAYLLESQPELLVDPGDVGSLGNKLGWLCRNAQLDDIGRRVRNIAHDRFSEDSIADRWRELLFA